MPVPQSPLPLLQTTTFVSTLDRFVMPPLLVAIAADLGVPLSETVQAAGVYFLAYGLCQPLWGGVADRLGRVRTMRLTLVLAGVAGLASTLAWSTGSLAAFRGVAGGLFGAAYPSTLIYVGDTVPPATRQRDIARLMVGVAVGTGAASLLGGLIAAHVSWRFAFLATGMTSILLGLALGRLPEPSHTGPRPRAAASVSRVLRSPVAVLVLVIAFAEGAVLLGVLTLMPPAVESAGAGAAVAGAVTAVYGGAVFVGAAAVGRASLRWQPWVLIAVGALGAVLACALLVVSRGPVAAAVAAVLVGLAWTSMHSSIQTWATAVVPEARAMMIALFACSLFVGSAVGSVAVSGLAGEGRFAAAFAAYAVLAVPLGVVAARARARWDTPESP